MVSFDTPTDTRVSNTAHFASGTGEQGRCGIWNLGSKYKDVEVRLSEVFTVFIII